MTWIRMDCSAPDDLVFDQLGEALGIESMQAFGHYFAVAGKLATLGTDGRLDTVLDRTLEQWAKWTGTRGGFAGVFRGFCQDPVTGELRGFRRRNEKLLLKQAKDRQKRPPQRTESPTPTEPAGEPLREPSGEHPENPRANVYDNKQLKEALPERRSNRVPMTDDEQSVIDHYRKVHPKRLRAVPEKTLRLLRKALTCYSVSDLRQAIDGNSESGFHRDNNHMGLELILRDSEKIDYFMAIYGRTEERSDEWGAMKPHRRNASGEWEAVA